MVEESKDDIASVGAASSSKGGQKFTLFIKNLHLDVEEEDLHNLFAKKLSSVQVLSVRLIRDKVDSTKRGIAFVDVASQAMAESSLVLNQSVLKG